MLTKAQEVQLLAKPSEEAFNLRFLEKDEYPLWDALVDVSPQGSVFCQSWWLEAVGNVRVLACFSGDEVVAGIPLWQEKRFGIPVCMMPKLTQTWGVVMRPFEGKPVTVAARETRLLRAFATRLAQHALFFQAFHPSLPNWLPFYWSGFRQTTRFTYVLDDLSDLSRIWREMSTSTRGQITKAEKAGYALVPCGIEEVYRCESLSYSRHGKVAPHSESFLRNIYQAAQEHKSGACFAVVDEQGEAHSAWLLVWDRQRTHGLAGGADDDARSSGAHSLGVWRAIEFASVRSQGFDFTGSVVEGIERFNRNFGAKQVAYNLIMKAPTLVQCGLQLAGKL